MFDEILRQHYNLDKLQIKDKLIQGGGGFSYLGHMNLLIGIVLITIGLICMFYDKFWEQTQAKIITVHTANKGYIENTRITEKKIVVGYSVQDKIFTKIIDVPTRSNYTQNEIIDVFYDKKDPNIIKLNMFNHKITSSILILFGLYLIISKYIS